MHSINKKGDHIGSPFLLDRLVALRLHNLKATITDDKHSLHKAFRININRNLYCTVRMLL